MRGVGKRLSVERRRVERGGSVSGEGRRSREWGDEGGGMAAVAGRRVVGEEGWRGVDGEERRWGELLVWWSSPRWVPLERGKSLSVAGGHCHLSEKSNTAA